MVENAVLDETDAAVTEDLDWGMEQLGFTEEAELVSENLVTCGVSGLDCVLLLQFINEVDKSCIPNPVVIASLEGVKSEITELGDGVLCSSVEVTGKAKVGPSRYPRESAGWLPFRVEKVAIGWTS